MKDNEGKVCGRDVTQIDEIDWVPIEQATDTEPFLYVSKTMRLWAIIPGGHIAWFIFAMIIIAVVPGSGDIDQSMLTMHFCFLIADVAWLSIVYKQSKEKQQELKHISTEIEKPTSGVDGVYLIKSRNHIGLYDGKAAEVLLQTKYDFIERDEYGLYFVIKDGRCGLYDSEEKKFVLNCSYDEILDFDTDTATVLQSGVKKEVKLKRNK